MHILIAGAGQLGSRYLEGIAKCNIAHKITLIDPSQASLDRAIERFSNAGGDPINLKLNNSKPLICCNEVVDLAIISTQASTRLQTVKHLKKQLNVKRWILEKVLAQNINDINLLQQELSYCSCKWVNTPRRIMNWYKSIKKYLGDANAMNSPLSISIQGGSWGLACNAIHFIDLIEWLTGEEVQKGFVHKPLKWYPSKRQNIEDAHGGLTFIFSKNHKLIMESFDSTDPLTIGIAGENVNMKISESEGVATDTMCNLSIKGHIEYQSKISTGLVDEVLSTDNCELPVLSTSGRQHKVLLSCLQQGSPAGSNSDQALIRLPIT